jgi:hypothetical protein
MKLTLSDNASPAAGEKWLYASDTPDAAFLRTSERHAKNLPVVKIGYTHPILEGCECFKTGAWRVILVFLKYRLDEDYAALQKDAMTQKLPFLFQYVLSGADEVLMNMTRLYSIYHKGSVMYGDYIIRTGQDSFQLWAKKQQEQQKEGS